MLSLPLTTLYREAMCHRRGANIYHVYCLNERRNFRDISDVASNKLDQMNDALPWLRSNGWHCIGEDRLTRVDVLFNINVEMKLADKRCKLFRLQWLSPLRGR